MAEPKIVVLLARNEGDWQVRNDRFAFNYKGVKTPTLDEQHEAALQEQTRWLALRPTTEFKIVSLTLSDLRAGRY